MLYRRLLSPSSVSIAAARIGHTFDNRTTRTPTCFGYRDELAVASIAPGQVGFGRFVFAHVEEILLEWTATWQRVLRWGSIFPLTRNFTVVGSRKRAVGARAGSFPDVEKQAAGWRQPTVFHAPRGHAASDSPLADMFFGCTRHRLRLSVG